MRPRASEETVGQKVVKTIDPQRDNRPGLVKLTSEFYLGGEVKSCNINWSLRVALCALNINLEQTKCQSHSAGFTDAESETIWSHMNSKVILFSLAQRLEAEGNC